MEKISFSLPAGYSEDEFAAKIKKITGSKQPDYIIENRSLDARRNRPVQWNFRIVVFSSTAERENFLAVDEFEIPAAGSDLTINVVGSGPAGFFASLILQQAGCHVRIFERGADVDKRGEAISSFEKTGTFDASSNYCFGEGGAGTFSDGKLTSRSKRGKSEKNFILRKYVEAGAPEEILYMKHPHLGSDNLKLIVKNLRQQFISLGGEVLFETAVTSIDVNGGKVRGVETDKGFYEADFTIFATGHSAYETYRMLISRGVTFRPKNFAIGGRVEHPRQLINQAQWGKNELPGMKAAEYRLTCSSADLPVYTFCMCPGGVVVPSGAYSDVNIVNGMSYFDRDLQFSNAACVAGVTPQLISGSSNPTALQVLEKLEALERKFYTEAGGYKVPAVRISDFVKGRVSDSIGESSYPLGVYPGEPGKLYPAAVTQALRSGLEYFSGRIRGFETGLLMGLESKTSAPIQVLRDESLCCEGFSNLYLTGECSGYAGGIISSGVDGIKAALSIVEGSNS